MAKGSPWIYGGLVIVFAASGFLAWILPAERTLSSIAGNVGIVALIAALFQIARDDSAFRKKVALQHGDQQFQLGVTSHMANTVFDNHIAFCEEYMEEVRGTLDLFFQKAGSIDLVDRANTLHRIRRKHALWVTRAMSAKLARFEDDVRKAGANAHFLRSTAGQREYAEQRMEAQRAVTDSFRNTFHYLFGNDHARTDQVGEEDIINAVRSLLDVDRLVALRAWLIETATQKAKD